MKTKPGGLIVTVLVAFSASVHALAGDVWVDSSQADNSGDGSFGDPYKTIGFAMFSASSGDTIKLIKGTYDYNVGDNGESFPIDVKSGVSIQGQGSDASSFPRIGGDANEDVTDPGDLITELFVIEADGSSATRSDIIISKCRFIAEDNEDWDAPSAARFAVRNGGTIQGCEFKSCYVERSEMNDGMRPDNAAVVVDVGWGSADVTASYNTIYATARGGIEQRMDGNASDFGNEEYGYVDVTFIGNNILLEGADTALFGIKVGAVGDVAAAPGSGFLVRGNTVDSSGATGSGGIDIGIDVEVHTMGGGLVTLAHGDTFIIRNVVKGCSESGIRLRSRDVDSSSAHLSCWDVDRNEAYENLGAGIEGDWGEV